jgi:hypothetical protein
MRSGQQNKKRIRELAAEIVCGMGGVDEGTLECPRTHFVLVYHTQYAVTHQPQQFKFHPQRL